MNKEVTLYGFDVLNELLDGHKLQFETCNLKQFDGLQYSYYKTYFSPNYIVTVNIREFVKWLSRKYEHQNKLLDNLTK